MSDWEPIETAPRDGTAILGFCPSYSGRDRMVMLHYSAMMASVGRPPWRDGEMDDFEPTHWMPLPEPPCQE